MGFTGLTAKPKEFKTGPNLRRIGPYVVDGYDWRYQEAPVDLRALDGLKQFSPELGAKIEQNWHRKHGGNSEIEEALSRYRHSRVKRSDLSLEDREHWEQAVIDVENIFTVLPERAAIRPPHWYRSTSASAGLPYLRPKNEVHDELINDAYALMWHIMKTPDKKFIDYKVPPVIPFLKAQPSPREKYSTRGIWGFPGVITVLESMFFSGVYDLILKYRDDFDLPVMIGRGGFRRARSFIHTARDNEKIYSLDYIKGDANTPAWKQKDSFRIIEKLIDFRVYEGRFVSPEFSEKLHRVYDYLVWYNINTPIVYNNVLYRKKGGVASGAGPTLLEWIIRNNVDRGFMSRKLDRRPLRRGDGLAGGDDGLGKSSNPDLTLNDLLAAGEIVGAKFHEQGKSMLYTGKEKHKVKTLSTRFPEPITLDRDEEELFARCIYPSSWVSCREESVARVAALALSLCKTNPNLVNFADFYINWKPLSLDKPIKQDRDLRKYFRYVFGQTGAAFSGSTTLRPILKSYADDIQWLFLAARI